MKYSHNLFRTSLATLTILLIFFTNLAIALDLSLQRSLFKAADRALRTENRVPFEQLKSSLGNYPLYPYLLYRDLGRRLDKTPAAEIKMFLDTYADVPIAGRLYEAWLKQLAKEQRWRDYLQAYRSNQSVTLDCYYRRALLETGRTQAALENIEQLWMSAFSLPDACDSVFAVWRTQGGFTPQRVWRRFQLAIAKGQVSLARYLQKQLPEAERDQAELWLRVYKTPQLILERNLFKPLTPRISAILLHGLERWANKDSTEAANALDILKVRYSLPANALGPVERKIALYVASRGHPSALDRLTVLSTQWVDEAVEEWRVRVGLQRRDWQSVLTWLDRMTPKTREQPQWRYWRARALANSGRTDEANAIYQQLAEIRDYYGFLAADRLGLPYQIEHKPLTASAENLEILENLPGIQRARELFLLGDYAKARVEWRKATSALDDTILKAAAQLAQRWGWHDQAIVTLARTAYWDDLELRFPLPHHEQVLTQARNKAIDPAWIYAVMRQESIFRADARSPAGALGLMQIMPATGRRIASDLRLNPPSRQTLLQADTNIRFGAHYLRFTLNQLQNNPLLATAAYNAGPYRVAKWLPENSTTDADLWAETIPYIETRNYVKRVMEYAIIYKHRLGGAAVSIQTFMENVRPASS